MANENENYEDMGNTSQSLAGKFQQFTNTFTDCIKAIVQLLLWLLIGFASLSAAYIGVRAVLFVVKAMLNVVGIS